MTCLQSATMHMCMLQQTCRRLDCQLMMQQHKQRWMAAEKDLAAGKAQICQLQGEVAGLKLACADASQLTAGCTDQHTQTNLGMPSISLTATPLHSKRSRATQCNSRGPFCVSFGMQTAHNRLEQAECTRCGQAEQLQAHHLNDVHEMENEVRRAHAQVQLMEHELTGGQRHMAELDQLLRDACQARDVALQPCEACGQHEQQLLRTMLPLQERVCRAAGASVNNFRHAGILTARAGMAC